MPLGHPEGEQNSSRDKVQQVRVPCLQKHRRHRGWPLSASEGWVEVVCLSTQWVGEEAGEGFHWDGLVLLSEMRSGGMDDHRIKQKGVGSDSQQSGERYNNTRKKLHTRALLY